ncbi:MAG: serine/threonine protein kinase, partial [Alphaproteobacteria bacterium]|nr:serine/threonine protein kinase [Alphaproteobacteria bacterium]
MKKIGKYEIVRELGKGATSCVYEAVDPFVSRRVAIKVVLAEALGDKDHGNRYRKLFLTEASLAGKLSHPHIVSIYDAVADDEASYIVMEYVDGTTLEKHSRPDHLLPVNKVIEIIFKCTKALDFAARQGVIHRDIKPANIMLTGENDIKITDFGAAQTSATETTQITGIGSPAYMSPEQVREQPLSHQTDIFSLGVVLYQMLTGKLPFLATNNYSMIYQIINAPAPRPSDSRPDIPPQLDAIRELVAVFGNLQKPEKNIPDSEKFNVLRQITFFKNFADVELWEVLRITAWHKFPVNHVVIKEGDLGKSFFTIAAGEVRVTKNTKLLNVLRAGDCFGEMAYLGKKQFQRSASVVSSTDVTLIEIKAEALANASEIVRHQFNGAFL